MPFSKEQFINVFVQYNNAVFPVQILLFLLAVSAIYFSLSKTNIKDKVVNFILAFLWLWIGIVYHFIFFTGINKAAYMFALLFVIQGILFFIAGISGKLTFEFKKNTYTILGFVLITYAFFIYPVLGYFFGHIYPASPTFGVPCPTTIFTFGILLMTSKRVPKYLLIIPALWSILGFSAAFLFGIYEDIGLIISAIISCTAIFIRDKKHKVSAVIRA